MPMEIELGPAAAEFRAEVREWLHENRPDDPEAVRSQLIGGGPEHDAWAARLHDAGFLCVGWPKEYGGRGLSGIEVAVMNEEFGRAGIPRVTRAMGEWLVGPSIIVHGTDEQKAYFLPRIVDGTDRYCQGFSEPDAGSDLAGLKTRGVVDGDEIVVTGQKVWTSGAHRANMMFCLCRTDPDAPKHRGISYVLLPMKQADGSSNGFELRPIRQITGNSNFSETFITEARAPLFNVIGGLHNGWRVTMTTLGNERGGNATTQHVQYEHQFERIVDEARRCGVTGDARVRQRPRVGVHPGRDHALRGSAHPLGGRRPQGARTGRIDQQDVLVGVRTRRGRLDDEPARAGELDPARGRGLRARSLANGIPRQPFGHHLGRHRAGAAQHRRRARPRAPEGAGHSSRGAITVTDDALARAGKTGTTLAVWASRGADRVAIVSEHGDRTFGELNANANRLTPGAARSAASAPTTRSP